MNKTIIKNGLIYDPINHINGEVKDILIENGVIVEKFSNGNQVKEIDAQNKTVVPAGLDIHCHIATQQLNWVRLIGANYKEFTEYWNKLSLDAIARNYIKMGYTFVTEANVFPSLANQTIFNLQNLPVLDKAFLLNTSNLWVLDLEYQRHKTEDMAAFLQDLLHKTNAFGIKVYNPFENENWNFKKLREGLTNKGRLYNFTPLDVYESLTKAVEHIDLPHSIHAHIEGYETSYAKRNLMEILSRIKELEPRKYDSKDNHLMRNQIFHIAHASTLNIDGDNREIIKTINSDERFDLDLGCIGLNKLNPLITSDRRLIHQEIEKSDKSSPFPLITSAVESEGDIYASIRRFDKENLIDCIFWANAIDLALKTKNKWQIQLSFNYPIYSNVIDVPKIATWLLSYNARKNYMESMNSEFKSSNSLWNLDETLTFYEFVTISRASPAKSLGLGNIKGNLGVNADADLNILNINLNEIDIEKDYTKIQNCLSKIEYVLKSGEIVKHSENLTTKLNGKVYVARKSSKIEKSNLGLARKKDFYSKYSSTFYDNYSVPLNSEYLREI